VEILLKHRGPSKTMFESLRDEISRLERQDYAMVAAVAAILAAAWYQFLTGLSPGDVSQESRTIFIVSGLFDLVLLIFILDLLLHLHRIERRLEGEVEAVEREVKEAEREVREVEREFEHVERGVDEAEGEVREAEREVEKAGRASGAKRGHGRAPSRGGSAALPPRRIPPP
jgi:hypothetical protein